MILLLSLAVVSLASRLLPGSHSRGGTRAGQIEPCPAYQAQGTRVQSSEALYKATLGAYVPSVDAAGTAIRRNIAGYDSSSNSFDVTASLKLFDYKRGYTRDIARYSFNSEQEGLRKSLLDLEFSVKSSFYTTLASRGILEQRKVQLENARKNYEVAEGRRKFGVAKLSDVLQVSVRLEQARFNLVQAEGSLQKSLSELSSLIGTPDYRRRRAPGGPDL